MFYLLLKFIIIFIIIGTTLPLYVLLWLEISLVTVSSTELTHLLTPSTLILCLLHLKQNVKHQT
jgi:hypothetical protein